LPCSALNLAVKFSLVVAFGVLVVRVSLVVAFGVLVVRVSLVVAFGVLVVRVSLVVAFGLYSVKFSTFIVSFVVLFTNVRVWFFILTISFVSFVFCGKVIIWACAIIRLTIGGNVIAIAKVSPINIIHLIGIIKLFASYMYISKL